MFRKNGNIIESDEGFSIEKVGYSQLIYKEGDKTVRVYYEHLVGSVSMCLYLCSSDHWEPPFDKERITDEDWKRIGENIQQAYKSQGVEINKQWPLQGERDIWKTKPE